MGPLSLARGCKWLRQGPSLSLAVAVSMAVLDGAAAPPRSHLLPSKPPLSPRRPEAAVETAREATAGLFSLVGG